MTIRRSPRAAHGVDEVDTASAADEPAPPTQVMLGQNCQVSEDWSEGEPAPDDIRPPSAEQPAAEGPDEARHVHPWREVGAEASALPSKIGHGSETGADQAGRMTVTSAADGAAERRGGGRGRGDEEPCLTIFGRAWRKLSTARCLVPRPRRTDSLSSNPTVRVAGVKGQYPERRRHSGEEPRGTQRT